MARKKRQNVEEGDIFKTEGICPNCKSDDLDYRPQIPSIKTNEQVCRWWTCSECGTNGVEVHNLRFEYTEIVDGIPEWV